MIVAGTSLNATSTRQIGLVLPAVIALLLVGGCGSSTGNVVAFGTAPTPPAMQHPRLEGFPIPPGFALIDKKSFIEKSSGLRTAHCEFTGGLSIAELDRFYRERMPEAGFTLRSERLNQGDYQLEFISPKESSTVSFKGNGQKTTLIINVNPSSGGSGPLSQPQPKSQP